MYQCIYQDQNTAAFWETFSITSNQSHSEKVGLSSSRIWNQKVHRQAWLVLPSHVDARLSESDPQLFLQRNSPCFVDETKVENSDEPASATPTEVTVPTLAGVICVNVIVSESNVAVLFVVHKKILLSFTVP